MVIMGKFLKNFGLGLVYVIFFPVLLAMIAIMGVYGFIVCATQFFKGTIRFFKGLEPFPPFSEDLIVERVKEMQIGLQTTPQQNAPTPAGPSTVYVQQNYYQNAPHSPEGQQPSPQTPIETTGFYNTPANPPINPMLHTQTPPTLDTVDKERMTPSIEQKKPDSTAPAAYIDISKDDNGKDN